jgi:5-methyltetrahydrofolate--homocysteine methyltransferase
VRKNAGDAAPARRRTSILDCAWDRILVFDGAMGTSVQALELSPDDYHGHAGCIEYLVKSRPEAIQGIHAAYLEAGAQVIETDTFGGARHILAEHGLGAQCRELNRRAARLACAVAADFTTRSNPRFVAGSIGPGSKLPSLGQISFEELRASYRLQVDGLLAGGVDLLITETSQDLLQVKAALVAIQDAFAEQRISVPVIASVTVTDTGQMLAGSEIAAVLATLESMPVSAIGVNCGLGPQGMTGAVWYLADHSSRLLSVMPNAGMPRATQDASRTTHHAGTRRARIAPEPLNPGTLGPGSLTWELGPEEFARQMQALAKEPGVNIVGGCCGTTPEHIRQLARAVAGIAPRKPAGYTPRISSLYQAQEIDVRPKPLVCGERTNANGSLKFRELLAKEDFDGMAGMAQEQEKEQAHLIDLSLAAAGRKELDDMARLTGMLNAQSRLPVMVDSTNPEVVEAALQRLAGRCIVNSINLEDGGRRARKTIELCRRYGAAVVGMAIDEQGMAMTARRKLQVARRLYRVVCAEGGLAPSSLFLDFLTFTLASGDPSLRSAGSETLEALAQAQDAFPDCFTLLGVSNISYGLPPDARKVLNTVFLTRAIERGLDAAIVHAGRIKPLHSLPKEQVRLCDDLIFNRARSGRTPLERLLEYFKPQTPSRKPRAAGRKPQAASVERRLTQQVLDGNAAGLEALLAEVLRRKPALAVIQRVLLPAMDRVGELFRIGKLQLPFVLRSAEVMRKALDILEPKLGRRQKLAKGSIVLATVRGDIHDIGKNLVEMILASNSFKVHNLGVRQSPESVLAAARRFKPDAVGLSGLLVESARAMKEYLEVFAAAGLSLPVLLGGAALTREFVTRDLQPAYPGKVYYARDAMAGLALMQRITERVV